MMPLTLAQAGEESVIQRIGGSQEVRAHLGNLGFVVGGTVQVVNTIGGNVIVNVKESRIAVSREMAQKIMILPAGVKNGHLINKEEKEYENVEAG